LYPGEKQTRKLRSRARGKVKNTNVVRKNTNVVRENKMLSGKIKMLSGKIQMLSGKKTNTVVREEKTLLFGKKIVQKYVSV
jgi:hypothetical protein